MRIRMLALAVLLLAVGWLVSAPVPKALKKRTDYYPCAAGTKRLYTGDPSNLNPDFDQSRDVVDARESDGGIDFTVRWIAGRSDLTWAMRKDENGVHWLSDGNQVFDTPQLILKPKLIEGDEWTNDVSVGKQFLYKQTRTVGKEETVSTPAGDFAAIPIRVKQPSSSFTYWYSDGVGLVKITQDGALDMHLKTYRIGDGK